eukprot:CAMPEP_0113558450 /NCGR_PEP_ID=MMETSP0015_2-20120614/18354_1 /TAXON_ID=2838 /ORGANISM="Odontella" /LENGTH=243 /DNA_ID=CAMNT_0000459989 /DNA_START=759 /DNA_END=1493 /DNA_ORIENTATION=- /assembly_acc=CAM_ASM_000160
MDAPWPLLRSPRTDDDSTAAAALSLVGGWSVGGGCRGRRMRRSPRLRGGGDDAPLVNRVHGWQEEAVGGADEVLSPAAAGRDSAAAAISPPSLVGSAVSRRRLSGAPDEVLLPAEIRGGSDDAPPLRNDVCDREDTVAEIFAAATLPALIPSATGGESAAVVTTVVAAVPRNTAGRAVGGAGWGAPQARTLSPAAASRDFATAVGGAPLRTQQKGCRGGVSVAATASYPRTYEVEAVWVVIFE